MRWYEYRTEVACIIAVAALTPLATKVILDSWGGLAVTVACGVALGVWIVADAFRFRDIE